MRAIALQSKMFKFEIIDIFDRWIDFKIRECVRCDGLELFESFDMITVDVHVSHHVHKFSPV